MNFTHNKCIFFPVLLIVLILFVWYTRPRPPISTEGFSNYPFHGHLIDRTPHRLPKNVFNEDKGEEDEEEEEQKSPKSPAGLEGEDSSRETIFISVASYRDPDCKTTLEDIFEKAEFPNRIYIGVCEQNHQDEIRETCVPMRNPNKVSTEQGVLGEYIEIDKSLERISVIRVPYIDAKGPTYARYLCSSLWNGQTYYLQIDSHTTFMKNWDSKLIKMIKECSRDGRGSNTVISYFPPDSSGFDAESQQVPYTCNSVVQSNGVVRAAVAVTMKPPQKCTPILHLAAGMIFLKSDFLRDVPFDPWLDYVFDGEEILLSARLWTNGYDFFMPQENICSHLYNDGSDETKKRSLIWEDASGKGVEIRKQGAIQRMKHLLGVIPESKVPEEFRMYLKAYGMGTKRSLSDFYHFIGVKYPIQYATEEERAQVINHCGDTYDINTQEWVPIHSTSG